MKKAFSFLLLSVFFFAACSTTTKTPPEIPTQEPPTVTARSTVSPPIATATPESTPTITATVQFHALMVHVSSTAENCPGIGDSSFEICVPGLFVTLMGRTLDNYTVTVSGPGFSEVTFECPQVTTLLHFGENMAPVDCNAERIRLVTFGANELTLEIKWDGGSIIQTYHPVYELFAPNGEQCDPQCPMATMEINVP